jgi:hypothetical protein
MRVLAAAFRERRAATRVLQELVRRYELRPDDASVAPLGTAGQAPAATVLAGRFHDEVVPEIRRVVAENGGEVLSEVDERWTRSPAAHDSLEDQSASNRPN